ncbi:GNAT family N-acetyltransferase [Paracoccus gahaiensis]|uniref:GNAT family N-acetyltransferase n=1 Tax=Paracoccus gahaiensis TaxID=1706839 RepID=A0A4U0R7M4_9RHOB|nr:GNAT family N-acetyltransferase [Paracoccus gahaiensis]TJZ90776.1 GNAT family N-acetyltransferase [Paracoccus gahaiensis]
MIRLDPTPILTTDRLTLRAPQGSDWPHWRSFHHSDRARFIGGGADQKTGTSWRAFGHVIGHWAMRGFGMFVFTLKGDDTPLGMTGPWFPEGWPEGELGWTAWSGAAEGRGLVAEAARAARGHAFATLGWTTAVSYIHPDNARSIALAERLGAIRDRLAPQPEFDTPCVVYRHPAPEAA